MLTNSKDFMLKCYQIAVFWHDIVQIFPGRACPQTSLASTCMHAGWCALHTTTHILQVSPPPHLEILDPPLSCTYPPEALLLTKASMLWAI